MCARCARDAREMRGVGRRKCALRVRCSKIDSRSRRARGDGGDAMGDSTHTWRY